MEQWRKMTSEQQKAKIEEWNAYEKEKKLEIEARVPGNAENNPRNKKAAFNRNYYKQSKDAGKALNDSISRIVTRSMTSKTTEPRKKTKRTGDTGQELLLAGADVIEKAVNMNGRNKAKVTKAKKVKDVVKKVCNSLHIEWTKRQETGPITRLGGDVSGTPTTISFRMKMDGNDHVHVKMSKIEGAGYGLFASRNFKAGEYIGIYMGSLSLPHDEPNEYCFQHLKPDKNDLYMGMHFMNDMEYNNVQNQRMNRARNNAVLRVNYLVEATQDIRVDGEIYAKYQPSR